MVSSSQFERYFLLNSGAFSLGIALPAGVSCCCYDAAINQRIFIIYEEGTCCNYCAGGFDIDYLFTTTVPAQQCKVAIKTGDRRIQKAGTAACATR